MWSTGQGDVRQRMLGAAFDEECSAYAVGDLVVRPFSLNVHRRAERLGLTLVTAGVDAAKASLRERDFVAEVDAMHWLLCAPLLEVRAAFRNGAEGRVSAGFPCRIGVVADFVGELDRVIELARSAMFDTVPREFGGDSKGDDEPEELLVPGVMAATVMAIAEKLRATEEWVMEWLPLCRAFQYAHVVQWGNGNVWTVSRSSMSLEDDVYGERVEMDEGFGEDVEF